MKPRLSHFRGPNMADSALHFKGLLLDGVFHHVLRKSMGPGESPAISPPRDEAPPQVAGLIA